MGSYLPVNRQSGYVPTVTTSPEAPHPPVEVEQVAELPVASLAEIWYDTAPSGVSTKTSSVAV